jgi:hypothetical protein
VLEKLIVTVIQRDDPNALGLSLENAVDPPNDL